MVGLLDRICIFKDSYACIRCYEVEQFGIKILVIVVTGSLSFSPAHIQVRSSNPLKCISQYTYQLLNTTVYGV